MLPHLNAVQVAERTYREPLDPRAEATKCIHARGPRGWLQILQRGAGSDSSR